MKSFDPEFEIWRNAQLEAQIQDRDFESLSREWLQKSVDLRYSYQFEWLGVPIIQYPTDLVVFQELVWLTKPEVIFECGVARGGSLLYWASMQEICGITPRVIGVDIDIRAHAREAIATSKYSGEITLIEGDSTSSEIVAQIKTLFSETSSVMVVLDSNHTAEHVARELEAYAELVTPGNYLLVLDTAIEVIRQDANRTWGPGNSPWTAVDEFMETRTDFVRDENHEYKMAVTVAPNGIWKRTD